MTNPSRPASNGRDAAAGSSLRVDSARIAAKPADHRLVDPGLGAAGDHHVRVAAPDDLARLAERVAAGGARRHRREVRPGHPELDGDLAGADVRDAHRDEERADPVGPRRALVENPSMSVPTPPRPVPRITPGPLGQLALEPFAAGRPGRAPRERRPARTGCSGRCVAAPCGRGSPLASKSRTSAAIREVSRDGSNASIGRTPERPATRPAQVGRDVVARAP